MDERGTALVHHLGLPLRVEILRDDADDTQDFPLPWFEDEAVLLEEIKQVFFRKIE